MSTIAVGSKLLFYLMLFSIYKLLYHLISIVYKPQMASDLIRPNIQLCSREADLGATDEVVVL